MISPSDIKKKARRKYRGFLRTWLQEESFFPLEIRFRKVRPGDDYLEMYDGVQRLQAGAKNRVGFGYTVELDSWNSREYGVQFVPVRIAFESEEDYIRYLGKKQEVRSFKRDARQIQARYPRLEPWLQRSPQKVIAHAGKWPALLEVCRYFVDHPRPKCYIREIPVSEDTKFIERHQSILRELLDVLLPEAAVRSDEERFERRYFLQYDEPLVRFRVLDDRLREERGLPVSDLSVPCSEARDLPFQGCRYVITENKTNFLTLPPLPQTIGLFGAGQRVEMLKELDWLGTRELFYWGDLDAHGFSILSGLRSFFPAMHSVMMDRQTLERFEEAVISGTPLDRTHLPHLTADEHTLFTYLRDHNLRLEQEKIDYAYVIEQLRTVVD